MFRTSVASAALLLGASSSTALSQEAIELSEYIESLRNEFIQLSESGGKDKLPLYISPIEIEINVVVEKEGTTGVKFYVVDAGGSIGSATSQRLRFTVSLGGENEVYMTYQPPVLAPMFRRMAPG